MKNFMKLSIVSIIFLIGTNAFACELDVHVDSTAQKDVVFNVVSTDGKYQLDTPSIAPGHSYGIPVNCATYNIYAQYVDDSANINPFGDYAYIANPLTLTGDLAVFFPSRFQATQNKLAFPSEFKKTA
ncbi:MAG: hypothetical protein COV52_00010 [Gammaproteobacteria bacterium CG11_big_fil_rev_8_21_14_0_20_46_22]|nr:MAG: hypothetical protein COW05_02555 [Gammaproteobacteria bacterium CG12_big_fil_rev_8_21_14_0_65_46_12]PIR12188.1 MAG: hypothetical protein COV52_00010 [Gammaproteobacteria bacterium CG11_big_fil_rev_8_21_14_0_20_46_22]